MTTAPRPVCRYCELPIAGEVVYGLDGSGVLRAYHPFCQAAARAAPLPVGPSAEHRLLVAIGAALLSISRRLDGHYSTAAQIIDAELAAALEVFAKESSR
jgi:hypothetical protein